MHHLISICTRYSALQLVMMEERWDPISFFPHPLAVYWGLGSKKVWCLLFLNIMPYFRILLNKRAIYSGFPPLAPSFRTTVFFNLSHIHFTIILPLIPPKSSGNGKRAVKVYSISLCPIHNCWVCSRKGDNVFFYYPAFVAKPFIINFIVSKFIYIYGQIFKFLTLFQLPWEGTDRAGHR